VNTDVPSKGYTSTRFLNSFAAARLPIPHCARRPPSAIAEINFFIASSSSQASTNWTCSDPCWNVIQRLVSFSAFDTYGIVYRQINASIPRSAGSACDARPGSYLGCSSCGATTQEPPCSVAGMCASRGDHIPTIGLGESGGWWRCRSWPLQKLRRLAGGPDFTRCLL